MKWLVGIFAASIVLLIVAAIIAAALGDTWDGLFAVVTALGICWAVAPALK